jgi:hypothetical protein
MKFKGFVTCPKCGELVEFNSSNFLFPNCKEIFLEKIPFSELGVCIEDIECKCGNVIDFEIIKAFS